MQLYLLHALYKWQVRSGDFRGFRELTDRIETVAKEIPDPLADAIAHGSLPLHVFSPATITRFAGMRGSHSPPRFTIETQPGEFWNRCTGQDPSWRVTCGCWDTPSKRWQRPKEAVQEADNLESSLHSLLRTQ